MASTVPGLDEAFDILRNHGHTIGDTVVDADGIVKTLVDTTYLNPGEIKELARVRSSPEEVR